MLLAKIIGNFLDFGAALAGLGFVDDAVAPPVQFETAQQLEYAFVERRPHDMSGSAFTFEPKNANEVRAKLLEMALRD